MRTAMDTDTNIVVSTHICIFTHAQFEDVTTDVNRLTATVNVTGDNTHINITHINIHARTHTHIHTRIHTHTCTHAHAHAH